MIIGIVTRFLALRSELEVNFELRFLLIHCKKKKNRPQMVLRIRH